MTNVSVNGHATSARRQRLATYMSSNVLDSGTFICPSYADCRSSIRQGDRFFEGQLSHLGHHYDLEISGGSFRVMVVGQEYGLRAPLGGQEERSHVSLDDRYAMVHDGSGLGNRYYKDGPYPGRNPHMRGTTSALRVLFGSGLGSDYEGEFLTSSDGERFHIFDAFALVNVLLCSAGPVGSSQGRSSTTMRRNCLRHFAATTQILEPTIIVLQGKSVEQWLAPIIRTVRPLGPNLSQVECGGVDALMCSFTHPSAHNPYRWGDSLVSPYLTQVVEPTLTLALEESAALRGPSRRGPGSGGE